MSAGPIGHAEEASAQRGPEDDAPKTTNAPASPWKSLKIWMVMLALFVATFLAALDLTAMSTALPTISNDIGLDDFIWVGSAYGLASTVVLPLFGSLAIIYGRRAILCLSIVLFAIGSALCGSATSQSPMIAGRTIQGVGGGGIVSITDILITDLFPLSLRGQVYSIFGAIWALASACGPPIAGALAEAAWRWLFYMNLPLSGLALALVMIFCQFHFPTMNAREKLRRFDLMGNVLFISGSTALVMALTWGGHPYSWSSAAVLVPLIVGLTLLASLFWVEQRAFEPAVPLTLLSNRTSAAGYASTCLHAITVLAIIYYWPIYFQVVKQTSAVRSGINLFPLSFTIAPFSIIAGFIVAKTHRYKALNCLSWIMAALGFGLMYLIKPSSPTAMWAGIPIVVGIPCGVLFTATLFPVAAPLPVEAGAQMMSFYGFAQNFGNVLGITMGGVILQNDLPQRLPSRLVEQFDFKGDTYSLIPAIATLNEKSQEEVKTAVTNSLRVVWIACVVVCGLGLFVSLWMKSLPLPEQTDERYALKEEKREVAGGRESA